MSEEKNIDDNVNLNKIASEFVDSLFEQQKIDNDILIQEQNKLETQQKTDQSNQNTKSRCIKTKENQNIRNNSQNVNKNIKQNSKITTKKSKINKNNSTINKNTFNDQNYKSNYLTKSQNEIFAKKKKMMTIRTITQIILHHQ